MSGSKSIPGTACSKIMSCTVIEASQVQFEGKTRANGESLTDTKELYERKTTQSWDKIRRRGVAEKKEKYLLYCIEQRRRRVPLLLSRCGEDMDNRKRRRVKAKGTTVSCYG